MALNNFLTIESEHGTFIVNRHCAYQAEVLVKTGKPHIQDELDKVLAIVGTLPEGSVALDAGANIGLIAIPLAKSLLEKHGVVYAFEPQRMMAYALSGAAALNDLDNIYVRNQALGSVEGRLHAEKIDYGKPQDFGLYSLLEQGGDTGEIIEVVTIDALNLKRLDFLKIDVEGMELEVLAGGQKTISENMPWCWVEYWKLDINDIKAQFSNLEYRFYRMDELNLLCAPSSRLDASPLNINAKEV